MADKPRYHAFTVRNYKKADGLDDAFWTKIGAVSFYHVLVPPRLSASAATASGSTSNRGTSSNGSAP